MFHFYWFLKWFCRVDVVRFKMVAREIFFLVLGSSYEFNFPYFPNFGKGFQAGLSGQPGFYLQFILFCFV